MAQFTRRTFGRTILAGTAAASTLGNLFAQDDCSPPSGTPVDFVIPSLQNIQRKGIAELTPDEVTRLGLAYQKLRDLTTSDPSDPRGWMQQAKVHCWQCGGSGTDIHQSWTFLPWHRAYLYFHERILCTLLGDDTFRLPYWSWDDANERALPAIYQSPTAGAAPNSLYDANRSADAVNGSPMPASIFPALQNPMNSANFASFGGGSDAGGSLENGPHGAIHMWAGGPNDPYADMGNLSLAARDPIFYAHHCNIDRLWAEFSRRNPVAHANPTDAQFLTRSFQFFDENKQLVNIRVQDVLDPAPLGFSYPPGAKLSASKLPKWTQLNYDPATHLIRLPDRIRAAVNAPSVIAVKRSLVVEQVKTPMKSGTYNVFLGDAPASGAGQTTASNYLGYIGIILGQHAHNSKCSLVLNASNEFLQRAGDAGARLTFAPAGTTNGSNLEFSSAYLTEE
jgi:polyphenol oxidase